MKLKALLRAFPVMLLVAAMAVAAIATPVGATVTPLTGAVGSTVSISVTGVSNVGATTYTVQFIGIEAGNNTVNATVVAATTIPTSGTVTASFAVPTAPRGQYRIDVITNATPAQTVTAGTFTVIPAVTVGPTAAAIGTPISVSCTGFTANVAVNVSFGSITTPAVAGNTDANGTFTASFLMPQVARFTYTITAREAVTTTNFATTLLAVTPRITAFSADAGAVGDSLVINGDGFTAFGTVSIFFDSETTTALTTVTASTAGVIPATTVTIPAAARGTHVIIVRDNASPAISTSRNFSINQSKITVTPTSGQVGTTVTINGTGFNASSVVDFDFDGLAFTGVTSITTSNIGSFSKTGVIIPTAAAGPHTIRAKVTADTAVFGDATFTISSRITITPITGTAGTTVSVSGSGFSPNGQISVGYDGAPLATAPSTVQIAANGTFNAQVVVPGAAAGAHTISVADGQGNTASAVFTSTITADINPVTTAAAAANIGQDIVLTGTGFKPSSPVTVKLDNANITTANTSSTGTFTATFKVPTKLGGTYKVNVSDGLTTREFDLFIEKQAPAAPSLTTPVTATKAEQPITFEWGAVTDPSAPITYKLEVSADSTFTAIVMTKDGLTGTSYAMTEAEKLETVSKKAPYYWRVTATDGAGNVGAPSTPSTFTVGFSLSDIPVWAWVTIGFFSVVIIGGVVYLLMRRKAAY